MWTTALHVVLTIVFSVTGCDTPQAIPPPLPVPLTVALVVDQLRLSLATVDKDPESSDLPVELAWMDADAFKVRQQGHACSSQDQVKQSTSQA